MIVDFLSRIITILNFTQLHLRQTRYSINSSKSKTSITPDQRKIELLQKGEVKVPFLMSVYTKGNGQLPCLYDLKYALNARHSTLYSDKNAKK